MSTAYYPQTDRQTEHVNQALEQYLRYYVDYNLSNWSDLLPSAEFTYNNQVHRGIKESPFYLEYGRHPRAGPSLVKELLQRNLNDLTYKQQEALEQAKAALTLAAERMKRVRGPLIRNSGVHSSPLERSCSRSNITM